MCEHANAIAKFEHEVRPRHDVSVAAANLRDDRRFVARHVEIAERSTHHARAGHEHAQVIEIAPILGLLLLCVVLTVLAGPVMRFIEATAESLHAPATYVPAVLGPNWPPPPDGERP